MERLAAAPPETLPIPVARKQALQGVAAAIAAGELQIDHGDDRRGAVDELCRYRGIGPWTAELFAMRGLGDPDVFVASDLVIRRALDAAGLDAAAADRWRPWRSYAMHHLWATVWRIPT
jgi:AraC family transcriptional regulator of adaptative response / DNA-3-methyladenine glycosylase II